MRLLDLFFVLALYLGAHAAEGRIITTLSLSLSAKQADRQRYRQFISQLRKALTTTTSKKVYNIPLLPDIPQSTDFILIRLSNYDKKQATVAVDAANVYLVGAAAYGKNQNISFFFEDVSQQSRQQLFDDTSRRQLSYKGNYDSLERLAGRRSNLDLGLGAFSTAIGNLVFFTGQPSAAAFLVIIQMISEAARFKYIEHTVSDLGVNSNFKPDLKFQSLENQWSALSKQIQLAQNNSGNFLIPVQLINSDGSPFSVINVHFTVVTQDIALLLNSRTAAAAASDDEPCTVDGGEFEATVMTTSPSDRRCGQKERKGLENAILIP